MRRNGQKKKANLRAKEEFMGINNNEKDRDGNIRKESWDDDHYDEYWE